MHHAKVETLRAPARKRASLSQTGHGWQQAMRESVTDIETLLDLLAFDESARGVFAHVHTGFPLRVPRSYVARMRPGDVNDPLLRQVLPVEAENADVPGFSMDAVGDHASALGDGVLHKYHGRALLVTTGACAVHCRYCFRRHFDYANQHAGARQGDTALAHIAADTSINEVILSGGDPLSLSNARLEALGEALDAIEHVTRIRIHTRTAVVLPERIDAGLVNWVSQRRQQVVIVIHANHAQELDDEVAMRLAALREAGATLLNQAVLLKNVNDDVDTLIELSERLFAVGVMPYYLHMLDRVAGSAHFEVAETRARALVDRVAARLPGYLVPRLARENAGDAAKQVLGHDAGPSGAHTR
ncbi:EF-P beta-lysylation protein EpmB [Salinisphaera sp.]|uniref:EF-P beta-lysylation protein EpmB n=1 Tax=Salinisphaera sp. TaxID=1914330 RepID=UPI000C46604D|nr:EF-P beta-lysylation protein EpmB [Salinisphaera sp.]MBS62849.1 EF-P beta-lysylation protein EpmB [Salinisphaera sp.]